MNRIFATLTLAALALSSCIKENDSYKDLLPVQPGQYIYSYVTTQDRVAMQAANAGMRVAVLAAEVAKQRGNAEEEAEEVTVANVKYNNRSVLSLLFNSGTKIEEVEQGYKLTFNKSDQMPDGFYLEGSLLVETGGKPELADGAVWSVVMQSDFKLYSSSYSGETQINMNGGSTRIADNGDGSYTIQISNIAASIEGSSSGASDWSSMTGFTVRPSDDEVTLAYSSCVGKAFEVNGSASGYSIYSNMYGSSPLQMSYRVSDGLYIGMQIVSGTQECEFSSPFDYDTSAYPAPDVRYVYSFDEASRRYSFRIYYNGYVYPKD
ncbi:hypothetical protein [uncultured Alistipes sp.]|uniref:hypothetical protein n=1 Tax=uncultured Alistipes sp. TaxID=538949 RepID=UPI00320B1EFD